MCIMLEREPNEGRNGHPAGGTRTARGRIEERPSHHGRGGRQHGGNPGSSTREARTGVFADRSAQNNRPPAIQSRAQERYGSRTGAVKNQRHERASSGNKEPGTTETQSALENDTQINRDRLRPAVSEQAPAAGSLDIPMHAAQDSTDDAESTAHQRAMEDGQCIHRMISRHSGGMTYLASSTPSISRTGWLGNSPFDFAISIRIPIKSVYCRSSLFISFMTISFETVGIKGGMGRAWAYLVEVTQETHGCSEAPAFSVQHICSFAELLLI